MSEQDHDELRSTAYHEAGHAVAAHALGRGIREVSILEGEDSLGHVKYHRRGKAWLERLEEANYAATWGGFIDGRTRRFVEVEIMIAAAGGLSAEKAMNLEGHEVGSGLVKLGPDVAKAMADRFGGAWEFMIVGGDADRALELTLKVSGSDDEASAYLAWLEERTRNLLDHDVWWAAVEGLAARLLVEPRMSGQRAREVMEGAIAATLYAPRPGSVFGGPEDGSGSL